MPPDRFDLRAIGRVSSSLHELATAPKQGSEGGPAAWIIVDPELAPALQGLHAGQPLLVLTWLHLAQRDVLTVHPRDDITNPLQGVFNTRAADRPNPIGLHEVTVLAVDGTQVQVQPLEAIDQTPVLDLKPALPATCSPC